MLSGLWNNISDPGAVKYVVRLDFLPHLVPKYQFVMIIENWGAVAQNIIWMYRLLKGQKKHFFWTLQMKLEQSWNYFGMWGIEAGTYFFSSSLETTNCTEFKLFYRHRWRKNDLSPCYGTCKRSFHNLVKKTISSSCENS